MSNRKRGDDANEWWVEARGYEREIDHTLKVRQAKRKLYEVLKHYGYAKAKGVGKQWVRCPFHDDRHASAGVDWDSGFFTCFACEYRGTAVDLVQRREGVDREYAIERILDL